MYLSGGSKGLPPERASIYGPKFSQFHVVFWKIGKSIGWHPLMEGWCPLLWGILDPPLHLLTQTAL